MLSFGGIFFVFIFWCIMRAWKRQRDMNYYAQKSYEAWRKRNGFID